eukprot:3072885-Pyramimonas_sp.AAC.1
MAAVIAMKSCWADASRKAPRSSSRSAGSAPAWRRSPAHGQGRRRCQARPPPAAPPPPPGWERPRPSKAPRRC